MLCRLCNSPVVDGFCTTCKAQNPLLCMYCKGELQDGFCMKCRMETWNTVQVELAELFKQYPNRWSPAKGI
jgi:hypothetical protein